MWPGLYPKKKFSIETTDDSNTHTAIKFAMVTISIATQPLMVSDECYAQNRHVPEHAIVAFNTINDK